jgi:hypothetical protein
MTQEEADHQIAVMQDICQDYKEKKQLEDECDALVANAAVTDHRFGEGR